MFALVRTLRAKKTYYLISGLSCYLLHRRLMISNYDLTIVYDLISDQCRQGLVETDGVSSHLLASNDVATILIRGL